MTTLSDQTAIRHKLLENGYVPLANVDKRCMLPRWPVLEVDHDLIDEWSARGGLRGTGVRMEGDLIALDFDIDDEDMLDAIWDAIEAVDAELFKKVNALPLRAGKGAKICLFARLETGKIDKLWSKAFYAPGARAADPAGAKLHRLEVFTGTGAGGARQVGVYGAHTVVQNEVQVSYRWADGVGLCDVPRDKLPMLRRKDVFALVDLVSRVMDEQGWEYEVSAKHGKITEVKSLTLLPAMRFETNRDEVVDLEGLEALAGEPGLRVALGFCEEGAVNRTRGLVGVNPVDGRVQIWDSATAVLYRPADLDLAAKIGGIGAGLKKLGLLHGFAPLGTRIGASGGSAARSSLAGGGGAEGAGADMPDMGDWEPGDGGAGVGDGEAGDADIMVNASGRCIVLVGEGDLTGATWLAARWLAACPDLYRRGGMVTRVVGGEMRMMSDARLAVELGERVMCAREEKAGNAVRLVEVDPPQTLVRQVAAVVDEVTFRDLRGVVDVPVVRRDGSVLCEDGWDKDSGLLVQVGDRYAGLLDGEMTRAQALECVEVLMRPFRGFPLVGAESRGALLAALLTAVVRPGLVTAPAFALDAPSAGSGKTLLASCVMALGGGGQLYAPLPVRDEAEVAKVLLSVLVEKPRVALFDNQVGLVDSASLAAVLTAPVYAGRILGSTKVVGMDTNLLVMFSGNNIAMQGDMTRRVLTVRIDAGCEAPAMRQFDFDPLREVVESRQDMVVAAVRLIRWAFTAGARSRGRVGSFEMWDEIVGQTVAALRLEDYCDPAELLRQGQSDDPRREETQALMMGLRDLFGGDWFKASDVVEAVSARSAGHAPVAAVLDDALQRGVTALGVARFLRYRRDTRVGALRLIMRAAANKNTVAHFRVASDDDPAVVEFGSWRERKEAAKRKVEHLKT
jgi:hypothetical protein